MGIFSKNMHQPNTETQALVQWHASIKYKRYILCAVKILTNIYNTMNREQGAVEIVNISTKCTCFKPGEYKLAFLIDNTKVLVPTSCLLSYNKIK